jgi:glycosyltransferase involved in cell wall biosynthesis
MKSRTTIVLQQPVIPDYRMGLFLLLKEHFGDDFSIFAGEVDFNKTTRSTPEAWKYFGKVRNHFIFGGGFLWQSGGVRAMLRADVLIVNANMRMLSNDFVLLARKMLGRRTIMWGHAEGKNAMAGLARGLFLRLCDSFIAYTDSQKDQLKKSYPWLRVRSAPNSCVFVRDCVPAVDPDGNYCDIIYVGRLVGEKKVRLLLEGFILALERGILPENARLVYVGAGPETDSLTAMARGHGASGRVEFAGHVSDVAKLREFYSRALVSVSPGYVGLSATQSFSFGVPMLVARNEFHSPEIEACREGMNAMFFESDNPSDLAEKLALFFKDKDQWAAKRVEISEWTKSHYSFEVMRDAIVDAVEVGSVSTN